MKGIAKESYTSANAMKSIPDTILVGVFCFLKEAKEVHFVKTKQTNQKTLLVCNFNPYHDFQKC